MGRVFLFFIFVCLLAVHRKARAASVVEVSSEVRSSLEEFLKSKSKVRMDDAKPLKMNPNAVPLKEKKKHPKIEMVEDALRMIYHELFEAAYNASSHENITDVISRYESYDQY